MNGNAGGSSSALGGNGGFGGGGEGGPAKNVFFENRDGGGGGGGYRDGIGGGGGGSFMVTNANTTLLMLVEGDRSGDGLVTIQAVSGAPTVTQPTNQSVTLDQPATLGPVFTDPNGQITCQWLKDGSILVGQTNATLSWTNFHFTDSGAYQAVLHNAANGKTFITQPAFITPLSAPILAGWGKNNKGQLGQGDTTDRHGPIKVTSNVVAVAGGRAYNGGYSLFIKSDETLWGTGLNDGGELGIGNFDNKFFPVQVGGGWR